LLYPPGLDFIAAFFGCLYTGAVAVPAYPPAPARQGRGQPRLRAILEDAAPRFVLTTAGLSARIGVLAEELPGLTAAERLATDEITGGEDGWAEPALTPETIAFLQYTSGSTSDPKGVMVSHGNLLHNEEVIRTACGHDERSTFVSWLPMYHDMGLIGGVLQPLYTGAACVLMAPVAFLQRPVRWLRAISRWRAHTSGAPDFAYELCARKIPPEQREGLDLSSWRIAFDGSEPVRARTLAAFAEAFAPSGFRAEAFFPCYGLAEATLIVSGQAGQVAPLVRAAPEDAGARPVVGCGPAGIDLEIAIVDPEGDSENLTERGPGDVGEIWVAGPSVARGYWNRPELTERTFHARLSGRSVPFLRTGDLGFLEAGQLFVTGRIKDLIIVRGRNHYPQDLELTVADSHPALRSGGGAAFAVETEAGEGIVAVQEVGVRERADPQEMLAAVLQALGEEHEVPVYAIVLVRPGAVPKTTSGKVQRGLCRQRFLNGELEPVAEWRAVGEASREEADPPEASIDWLRRRVAAKLGLSMAAIDPAAPLTRYGLDSLAAVELAHEIESGLGIELPLAVLLESPSLEALAAILRRSPASGSSREGAEPGSGLSPGERALWFLHQLDPASPAYNLAGAARIAGEVDEDGLRRAFEALVGRHPALRSTFHSREGEPYRRIQEETAVSFQAEDALGWSEDQVDERLEAETFRPFDLGEGPLLRVLLLRRSPAERVLLLVIHHLIADFWSLGLMVRELGRELAGLPVEPFSLPPPKPSEGGREDDFRYWEDRLADHPFVLDLPVDHPRPARPRHRAATASFVLPAEAGGRLAALGRERETTLFTLLLATFQALLHRISGQDRLLVGSPAAGRARAALADRVGYFVNPLVLAAEAAGDPSFLELAEAARRTVLGAFAHEVPFPELVERLQPERDPGQTPLFQVMLALQRTARREDEALAAFALNRSGVRLRLGKLNLESRALRRLPGQLDLTLMAAEIGGEVQGSLVYDTDLFDAATMARLGGHFRNLAASFAAAPHWRLSAAELWSAAERWQVTGEWNDTAMPFSGEPVDRRVAARAAEQPGAVAVRWGSEEMTYAELVERAERLAGQLLRMGVVPEEKVAVLAERRPGTVAALLAVLEAGGAYLPIDPNTPLQRVNLLLRDSGARVLLTDREPTGLPLPEGVEVVRIEAPPRVETLGYAPRPLRGQTQAKSKSTPRGTGGEGESLAYVIYTSGSTGTPKGVQITHGSLSSLVDGHLATCPLGPGDAVSWISGQGFDVSVLEIWPALAAGATLHLPDEETRSAPDLLWDWIAGSGLTHAFAPTPLAEGMLEFGAPALARAERLRSLWTAGDRLRVRPPSGLPFELRNYYGPTEDTVVATVGIVAPEPDGLLPTIGRPLPNRRAQILDAHLRPVPVGIAGELCLAGTGVARGYLGRPDQTAERFLPDPSGRMGERMFRTGDRVRLRADGEIEFLGRLDAQVKVRGFRVEPGEIEQTLTLHPGVREAAVLAIEEPVVGVRLIAFVRTAEQPAPRVDVLRSFLETRLPQPMIPAAFVLLEEFPLTANGKLDRRALAALAGRSPETGAAAPRSPLEEALAEIWRAALGAERLGLVGIHDDFFALGGHSLLATGVVARVRAVLGVELPIRALFEAPTIARLAARIEAARRSEPQLPPLLPVPRGGGLPLSFAQQRLWFLHQLDPGPAYHLAGALRLSGPLSVSALELALSEIARRQEALRTTFPVAGDQPVQVIGDPFPLRLPLVDLSGLPAADRSFEADRLEKEEGRRPFDLGTRPLWRAFLLRLGASEHRLAVVMHHIISDGWSLGVLLREIGALWGGRAHLPDLPVQAADFAVWQRGWLQGEALRSRLAWWERQLAGSEPVLRLPFDRLRTARPERRGRVLRFLLPPALTSALEELARRRGATLFMTLLAGWKALLGVYTGQRDLAVGSPIAGRDRIEIEGVIGCFVNTLVLRTRIPEEESFAGLLAAVRETALEAYDHQDLPFEKLVEGLRPDRSRGESLLSQTLFQTFFVLQNAPRPRLDLPEVQAVLVPVDLGAPKIHLGLTFERAGSGLSGELEIDTDLFDPATGLRLARHLETLLAGAVADPQRPLDLLPLLGEPESWQILGEWNDTASIITGPLIPQRIAARAAADPQALAVRGAGGALTYGELDRRANGLAWRLRALGVRPEVRVAVLAERRPETIAAQLAVWKAGGAYVPLDPSSPPARSAWLVEDARARVLLTEESFARQLPPLEAEIVLLSERPERAAPPDSAIWPESLAYVIYTSGSTGTPKGVEATHGSLANFVGWYLRELGVTGRDVIGHVSGLAFDAAVLDVWCCLAAGASLRLPDEETRHLPDRLRDWMLAEGITLTFLPTPLLEALLALEQTRRAALRAVVTGGDRLRVRPSPGLPFALWNGYGPTETTIFATTSRVDPGPAGMARDRPPPIGRPLRNGRVYLLGPFRRFSRELRPVPVGAPGELYVAGAGLARGYLGRPDQTAERFVPDPFGGAGERLYRTGDLARRRTDGELEFLGRVDDQVKIRGFRIEPGEIERTLALHPGVREAVVLEVEGRLAAFVEPGAAAAGLRDFLAGRLPPYMVPSTVVSLTAFPLTQNGKIDRRALAQLAEKAALEEVPETGYEAPRGPLEAAMVELWAAVLGVKRVGIRDHFFSLGGHSLLAAQLIARVRSELGVELPLRTFFEAPTVAGLAENLKVLLEDRTPVETPPPLLPVPRNGSLPLSFAQQRLWFLHQLEPAAATYHIAGALRLTGRLDATALERTLCAIAERQESLRTVFPVVGENPVQVIAAAPDLPLPRVDLARLPEAVRRAEADRLAVDWAARPFDLARGPLLRLLLVQLGAKEHHLGVCLHHIIGDGWSLGVLLREIGALYPAFLAGGGPAGLPDLPVQVADFAVWQRAWLQGAALRSRLAWWERQLAGSEPALNLPVDHPAAGAQVSRRGGAVRFRLPESLTSALDACAQESGATLFMILLAGWNALLYRLTGQSDIAVGAPVASRGRVEIEGLIGCFVNTLVLRTRFAAGEGFAALLARIREVTLDAQDHQDVPFEKLVEELRPDRAAARTPLFQTLFVLQNNSRPRLELPGLALELAPIELGGQQLDLALAVEGADVSLELDTALFDRTTILRMAGHFETLLTGAVADPARRLGLLPLLSAAERAQLLREWNPVPQGPPPGSPLLHERFAAWAARTPDAPAVLFEEECLTYGGLDRRSSRLARRLIARGVRPGDRVGLGLERSPDVVAAILGILKAGAAWVPLDPAYPVERLAFMAADAGVRIVLNDLTDPTDPTDPGEPDDAPAISLPGSALAYVLYTSGSTGQPKGVACHHAGVINFLAEFARWPLPAGAAVCQWASLSFDVCLYEIFSALLAGGPVDVAPDRARGDGRAYAEWLRERGIESAYVPPAMLADLAGALKQGGIRLKRLLAGVEPIPESLLAEMEESCPGLLVINGYGPTETTVAVTEYPVPAFSKKLRNTPIGRPMRDTRLYVLSPDLEPVPIGVAGELSAAGAGVAWGYLNRPDLTAERFVPDPFSDALGGAGGERMYRTGDLVRWLPDGNLAFIGRLDQQVKVRGIRIEPGEVEAALRDCPGVRDAAVAVRSAPGGDRRLVAWLAGEIAEGIDPRAFLRGRLPEAMIPSAFVALEALPLTANGKTDRAALPDPDWQRPELRGAYTAPRIPLPPPPPPHAGRGAAGGSLARSPRGRAGGHPRQLLRSRRPFPQGRPARPPRARPVRNRAAGAGCFRGAHRGRHGGRRRAPAGGAGGPRDAGADSC
jgi:amino acid adenylation domain-containing protein